MSESDDSQQPKETCFLHPLSPQLEKELIRRAKKNGRTPSAEATEIIEQHIEDNGSDD